MADRVNVDAELAEILKAIFGKDVRGSIHDGIKAIADGVNEVGNEWDRKVEDGDFNATIEVGTVTTGAPGTAVSVVNSGTNAAAVLDFTIPKGDTGSVDNVTAEQVHTSDGGDVQTKLDDIQTKFDTTASIADGVIVDNLGNQYGLLETGTSGPLTYYKYADGRLTYVVNATTSATITTASGGIYISALRSLASYTYPVPFKGIPSVVPNVGGNGHSQMVWLAMGDNLAAYDAPPDFFICSGVAVSNSLSYRVGMIIEGKWK